MVACLHLLSPSRWKSLILLVGRCWRREEGKKRVWIGGREEVGGVVGGLTSIAPGRMRKEKGKAIFSRGPRVKKWEAERERRRVVRRKGKTHRQSRRCCRRVGALRGSSESKTSFDIVLDLEKLLSVGVGNDFLWETTRQKKLRSATRSTLVCHKI